MNALADPTLLAGQSRHGEVAIRVSGRFVSINHCYIRGHFVIPKRRPVYSEKLKQMPDDAIELIVSYLPEVEQIHAEFFFSTLHCDDAPIYLDFRGRIEGERVDSSFYNHMMEEKIKELVPQYQIVTIDPDDGQVSIDSGAHMEFWLRFTLPSNLLPRKHLKRRSPDDLEV